LFHTPKAEAELFPRGTPLPLPPTVQLGLGEECMRRVPSPTPLPPDAERRAFLQYNYARMRAQTQPRWARRAQHLEEYLVRYNVALVGFAYQYMTKKRGHKVADADAVFSASLGALLRAVRAFDVSMKFKFSTYAIRVIINEMHTEAGKRRRGLHVVNILDEVWECFAAPAVVDEWDDQRQQLHNALRANSARLTAEEMAAVRQRFCGREKTTFQHIAASLHCSKERARQIVNRAIQKLQSVLV
jgi:RNA polymerase sigma factor (sigma-70 family)